MKRRELAERIAKELFVTGFGEAADRLVLMQEKPGEKARDLGGWSREAAIMRIEADLARAGIAEFWARESFPDLRSAGRKAEEEEAVGDA